ncbi:MAG: DUF2085 domain-containing protein [Blastocatellia bacterium]
MKRPVLVYIGLLMVTALWLAMVFASPWLWAEGHALPAALLYRGFSAVCHQMAERSFYFHGHQLGVCSRCMGIYGGFALGLALYPMVRPLKETVFPPRWILLIAAIPIAMDFLLGYSGLWANTFLSRTATGSLLGVVLAFFILPGFVSAFTGVGHEAECRTINQT